MIVTLQFFIILFQVLCKCKYKCKQIHHEHKTKLFVDFYKIEDGSKQNTFLMELINLIPINHRRKGVNPNANESHKQTSVSSTIPDGLGNVVKVCKKTFMDVFAITKRRIETLIKHMKYGEMTCKENKRQQATRGITKSTQKKMYKRIVDRVNSFPRHERDVYKRQHYTFQPTNVTRYWQSVAKLKKANTTPKRVLHTKQTSKFHLRKFSILYKILF